MPNIKPVSDLRNYNEVLRDVTVDAPVFLTKNSRGCYVITDIREYERQQATIKLLAELAKSEKSVKEKGWLSDDEVLKELGMQSAETIMAPEVKSVLADGLVGWETDAFNLPQGNITN